MNPEQLIFLISMTLQVSGALILIIFCWGNTEKRVLNAIFPANTSIDRNEDNTVIIPKEKLFRAHKEVLLNRTAFIFIGLGCLLSLFGSNVGINPWLGLLLVLISSGIFVYFGVKVSSLIAKCFNKADKIYQYEEFCSIIDKDVVTNCTQAEIEVLFNE